MRYINAAKTKIKSFPIGAWVPYYKENFNLDYLKDIKKSGINFIPTNDSEETTLNLLSDAGLFALVNDDRVVYSNVSTIHNVKNHINEYVNHNAYFMSFIWDEPSPLMMNICGLINQEVDKANENAIGYINLHPNYSDQVTQRCGLTYKEYLEYFINHAKPKVLSFDNYPFYKTENKILNYLENVKDISDLSAKYDIPFMFFVQSASFFENRIVTKNEMNFIINSSIAFGAKGYLYFTYKEVVHEKNFGYGLVDRNNNKTEIYYYAKEINERIQNLSEILLNSSFLGVKCYKKGFEHLNNYNDNTVINEEDILIGYLEYNKEVKKYIVNINTKESRKIILNNIEYTIEPGEAILI